MNAHISRFVPVALAAVMALAAGPAAAESALADSTSPRVGAALNFRVVIPPVVRVSENDHPSLLTATAGSPTLPATQRLVVHTNLRRGVCVDLQLTGNDVAYWHVKADSAAGATLTPGPQGYRLCVPGLGQHAVTLQHAFTLRANPTTTAQALPSEHAWPVQLQVTAL